MEAVWPFLLRLVGPDAGDAAIEALFNYNAAPVNLARALGAMQPIYSGSIVDRAAGMSPR